VTNLVHEGGDRREKGAVTRRLAPVVWMLGTVVELILTFAVARGFRMPAAYGVAEASPLSGGVADHLEDLSITGQMVARLPTLQSLPVGPVTSTVALTTTTVSLYHGDVCAVWGRTTGAFETITVPAGPTLLSFTTYSHYTDKPHPEYKYTFVKRVGDTVAALRVNSQHVPVFYRGELRIEYLPVPVSNRYSYTTYALVTLEPGNYEVTGTWDFASGEHDLPRVCHVVVMP
jgi:hypothetical protein